MTDAELRFLRAIIAEPFSVGSPVAPALIYADWLEEQAEDEPAKFFRGSHPRTLAFRKMVFGETPGDLSWIDPGGVSGGGWLVHAISEATPISPQQIDGWCEQLTAATGVPFSKRPRTKWKDDFVLSPARGVYVRMGEKPDVNWII